MKLASILPESSIDYPGMFGPVIFTQGCNLRCGFCHNPELASVDGQQLSDEELKNLKRDWEVKVKKWYSGVTISGGEPTLQGGGELEKLLRELKEIGFSIKLDTNGTRPEVLEKIYRQRLVDYVAMDVKGTKEDYPLIVGVENLDLSRIERSMGVVSQFPGYEFRTTVLNRYHSPKKVEETVDWIADTIGKKPRFFLQGFRNSGSVLNPEFKDEPEPTREYLEMLKDTIESKCECVGLR